MAEMRDERQGREHLPFFIAKNKAGLVKTGELQIMNNYLELGVGEPGRKEKGEAQGYVYVQGDGYADEDG